MTPLEVHFQKWRERCCFWLHLERGRTTALAKHLGVSRQTVWRWFNQSWSGFPGWAAVASNVFYYERAMGDDKKLRLLQERGPLYPRPLRTKKPTQPLVSTQADNQLSLVTVECDYLSADPATKELQEVV
jgi:hypothetical protein